MKSSIVRRGKTRNAMRFGGMASAGLDRGLVALGQRLIAFRVRAYPALGRRARERSANLGRRAEGEHAFGNLRLGRHQGTGGHHGAGADPRAVEHGRAVSNQAFIAERRRVDRAVVADSRAGADLGSPARRHVDDGAILHVGAAAHHDRVEVAAEDGVVPEDARSSIVTSPTTTAVGATNAVGCTFGLLPSKLNSGMGWTPAVSSKPALILLERDATGGGNAVSEDRGCRHCDASSSVHAGAPARA